MAKLYLNEYKSPYDENGVRQRGYFESDNPVRESPGCLAFMVFFAVIILMAIFL